MIHHVVLVLSYFSEPSMTVLACVRPQARVCVHVAPQVSRSGEAPIAHLAAVGLLLEVDPPVVVQVARCCEPKTEIINLNWKFKCLAGELNFISAIK